MVDLMILKGLSFSKAEQYLIEAGYVPCEYIKQSSQECDAILLYPYILYDESKCVIDKIYHAEYCMLDEDDELDDYKCDWIRA